MKKKRRTKRVRVQEALEQALFDSAYFLPKPNYPPLDLWTFAECGAFDGIYKDADSAATTRALNTGWLQAPENCSKSEADSWGGKCYAYHICEVPRKELRGLAEVTRFGFSRSLDTRPNNGRRDRKHPQNNLRPLVFKRAYRLQYFGTQDTGSLGDYVFTIAEKPGGHWVAINQIGQVIDLREHGDKFDEDQEKAVATRVGIAHGFQCFAEYSWRVKLQFDEHRPPLTVHVTKETIKMILGMRTMVEKERKKRFVTIVRKHQRAVEEGRYTDVMRHFRGRVFGMWQGCGLSITPPVNEIVSVEKRTKKIDAVDTASKQRDAYGQD